ncbi:ATP phosphoribosyltransferase regulatory subunit [Gammaproteobacteria bacterium]
MPRIEPWLLPEGIDELLPPDAEFLEKMRRELLDLFRRWGYEPVEPPLIDYLDSLWVGTGQDLALQTFTLTDQVTGRLLGLRADITPQVARLDAHRLRRETPTRLCYLGPVLLAHGDDLGGSRNPLQIGAELYGHAGPESEMEILALLMEALTQAGMQNVHLDLGHVGIFRGLAHQAGVSIEIERDLFELLQRKARGDLRERLEGLGIVGPMANRFQGLVELDGDDALERAESVLAGAEDSVHEAMEHLRRVKSLCDRWLPDIPVHFDLAELRGYHYKTGIVFAAFVPQSGQEIARGGRYDAIGQVFGRARPAVGFSADLKTLWRYGSRQGGEAPETIFVPWGDETTRREQVAALRAAGRRVVWGLPGQTGGARTMGCTQELIWVEPVGWSLRAVY